MKNTMKKAAPFLAFIAGALLTGLVAYKSAPSMMINENSSSLSYDDTVERIVERAEEMGWKVPATHTIHNSVNAGGYSVPPLTVIELCKVEFAGEILTDENNRIVASLMPCRIAVYQTDSGDVIVSRMNTGLMSSLFGGEVQRIMTLATGETEIIVASVME